MVHSLCVVHNIHDVLFHNTVYVTNLQGYAIQCILNSFLTTNSFEEGAAGRHMEFALPAIFRTVQRLQPEDSQEHQLIQQILRITEVLIYNSHKFAVFRVHSMLNTELQRMWEKLLNV